MGNKIVTNFSMFNESEAYVFEGSKDELMVPTEATLIEIMERQKKYSVGKKANTLTYKQRQSSLEVYESLEKNEKEKILNSVKEKFTKKKITEKNYRKIMDQNDPNNVYRLPFLLVSKEDIEKIEDPEPIPPIEIPKELTGTRDLFDDELEGSFFKNNLWKNEPASYNTKNLEAIKLAFEHLESIIDADINSEGTLIERIDVIASASRLRNTESSEGLSWLELGKNRTKTITQAIIDRVKKLEDSDEKDLKLITDKIKISYFGYNGDGTSGPDPLKNYKRGYYDNKGVFTDESNKLLKSKSTLDILVMDYDDNGKSNGAPKILKAKGLDGKEMTSELKDNETDYKKYQYNQITITFNPSYKPGEKDKEIKKKEDVPIITKLPNINFSFEISAKEWEKSKGTPPQKKRFHLKKKIQKINTKLYKFRKKYLTFSKKAKPFRSLDCWNG